MDGKTSEHSSLLVLGTLSGVPAIWALSNSMIIPVLPEIQSALRISPLQGGLLVTVLSVSTGLCLPLAGFLSDRLGRKTVMIPGIVIYGLGGLVAGLASWWLSRPYPWILAGRALQGIGAAGTTPLALALTADLFRNRRRMSALGILEAANSIGKLASPIFGSAAALVAWYFPFFIYPALALPVGLLLAMYLSDPVASTKQTLGRYFSRLLIAGQKKEASLLFSLLAGFAAIFLWFGTLFFTAEMLELRYSVGGLARGGALALPVLALAIVSLGSARYLQPSGPLRLVVRGLAVTGLALGWMLLARSWETLTLAVTLMGAGLGLVLPSLNTLITSCIAAEQRGAITTLYGSVRSFGSALGPPAFAYLMARGTACALVPAMLLSWASALLAYAGIKEKQMLQPGG